MDVAVVVERGSRQVAEIQGLALDFSYRAVLEFVRKKFFEPGAEPLYVSFSPGNVSEGFGELEVKGVAVTGDRAYFEVGVRG